MDKKHQAMRVTFGLTSPNNRQTQVVIDAMPLFEAKRFCIAAGMEFIEYTKETNQIQQQVVRTNGCAIQTIKHPGDKHDPIGTLKRMFSDMMKGCELDKFHRTILWHEINKQFDFTEFANLYTNVVLDQNRVLTDKLTPFGLHY